MNEMMMAISGSMVVKIVVVLAVLEAAQYFQNPRLLWWWVLVLFAGFSYKHTESNEEDQETANEK